MMEPAALRRIVEAQFRIYESREEKVRGKVAARLFYVMFPPTEFDARFESVKKAILAQDPETLVFMRRDGGEDILLIADRPEMKAGGQTLRLWLFLATLVTTILSGSSAWQLYRHSREEWTLASMVEPHNLFWGAVTFALPLILILGIHETAHYVAARRHGLRATLPMFLPAPPILMPIGTFGAFISMRDPLPDRKALFDVGASGPLAGFIIALPVIILGAFLTGVVAQPVPDAGRPMIGADVPFTLDTHDPGVTILDLGNATGTLSFNVTAPATGVAPWTYRGAATLTNSDGTTRTDSFDGSLALAQAQRRTLEVPNGTTHASIRFTWDDGLETFGDPLLVKVLDLYFHNDGLLTHPTFFAGWVGLLVTGINLLPVGQLDGGHVARAVLGDKTRYVAWLAVGLLIALAVFFSSWLLMALFVLYIGVEHPPPLNDRTLLDRKRIVVAIVVLAVFILTFVPVPIHV